MEARPLHAAMIAASLFSLAASHRTENFIVTAPSPQLSQEVAEAAENYRRDLAEEWLGAPLPRWQDPCPITVHVGRNLGAGGQTSFMFQRGRPFGWTMSIQGSRERILDSVLPHEITHTVFATHFGRPLPRWADEGACTTVEHDVEKNKQKKMLVRFLSTGRGIAFNDMFAMTEYPPDVLPLYAQGYSLARYLIAHGGKREFVKYVGAGMRSNNWSRATHEHYGFQNLADLQLQWLDWVRSGSPPLQPQTTTLVAANNEPNERVSGQSNPVEFTSAAEPPVEELATRSVPVREVSSGGWYARTRDQAQAARTRGDTREPSARLATATRNQSVTRPQPPGRPQQRVLEATSSPRRRVRGRIKGMVPVPIARQPVVRRDAQGGTVWR